MAAQAAAQVAGTVRVDQERSGRLEEPKGPEKPERTAQKNDPQDSDPKDPEKPEQAAQKNDPQDSDPTNPEKPERTAQTVRVRGAAQEVVEGSERARQKAPDPLG